MKDTIAFFNADIFVEEISVVEIKDTKRGWIFAIFMYVYLFFACRSAYYAFANIPMHNIDPISAIFLYLFGVIIFFFFAQLFNSRVVITVKNGKTYKSPATSEDKAKDIARDVNNKLSDKRL